MPRGKRPGAGNAYRALPVRGHRRSRFSYSAGRATRVPVGRLGTLIPVGRQEALVARLFFHFFHARARVRRRDGGARRGGQDHPGLAGPGAGEDPAEGPPPQAAREPTGRDHGTPPPEDALWAALAAAGPEGIPVTDLVRAAGKGRTWVYDRLRQWAGAGRVVQTVRGHWRAAGRDEQAGT